MATVLIDLRWTEAAAINEGDLVVIGTETFKIIGSPASDPMGLVLTWVLVEVQARAEEAALLADHGAAYRDWAGRVGRFVPGLGLGVDG